MRVGRTATRPSGVEPGRSVVEDCVRREDIRTAEEVPLMTALDFERKWEARPCIPELVLLSLVGEVRGVADRDRGWDGRQDGRIWPPVTHKEVP